MQPILRVFNTLKHIHTNTSTHLSATKIKMTLFLYVLNGKRIHLGSFDKESDVAKAYNMAVVDLWNGNGYLNSV
ncbi:hypothetical protein [Staphylococcus sp. GDY8P95P]|uniref:hypothetical protein n=1 Tax=Staphylococcus sp. GDY8P95P TaxID=2804145 RepID=UPI001AEC455C|nr:hypothetical protein [Staphylococcus sp. GDY8P95P]